MEVRHVFLGIPAGGDGQLSLGTHKAITKLAASKHDVQPVWASSSALTMNFNDLWSRALNRRAKEPTDRFIMLHTDLEPTANDWLDKLLALLDETGADVLSVISPIKDSRGLSSTALDTCRWTPRRLTFREIYELPETFDGGFAKEKFGAPLLLNTGLMVVRFEGSWIEEACFGVDNLIVNCGGQFRTFFEPEDWRFSRWCNARGLKLVATRAIPLLHRGSLAYSNAMAWGANPVDKENLASSAAVQTGQLPG